jgi:hypothetical protein
LRRNQAAFLLLGLFLTIALLGATADPMTLSQKLADSDIPLTASASFIPSNPDNLTNGNPVYDTFFEDTEFYYQTADNSYKYHVVWLRAVSALPFDLSLWNNSGYTEYLASCYLGAGELNWVVFYGTNRFWIRSHANYGGNGNLYIEWEAAEPVALGQTVSHSITAGNQAELYYVSMWDNQTYNLTLNVPDTGDHDLYLYGGLTERGDAFNPNACIEWSNTTGLGTDELIGNYTPPASGEYVVLIVRKSGTGVVEFTFDYATPSGGIPGFTGWILLLGILALPVMQLWKIHRRD